MSDKSVGLNPVLVAVLKRQLLRENAVGTKTKPAIEIFDTTLRDGEQTAGASFGRTGRLAVFRALDELGVQFVELGWPIASQEIKYAFADCREVQDTALRLWPSDPHQ